MAFKCPGVKTVARNATVAKCSVRSPRRKEQVGITHLDTPIIMAITAKSSPLSAALDHQRSSSLGDRLLPLPRQGTAYTLRICKHRPLNCKNSHLEGVTKEQRCSKVQTNKASLMRTTEEHAYNPQRQSTVRYHNHTNHK